MSKRKRDGQHGQVVAAEEIEENSTSVGESRERMVAEAAYYIAEHRAFQGGDPAADWLQAEREIESREIESRLNGR